MAMIRQRAAAGSDVDTRLLFSSRSWDDVIYRDELERLSGGRAHRHAHADALAAARLDRLRAPRRRRDARRGRPGPGRAAARLRLRPDAVRRGGRRGARGARARARSASRPNASDRREAEMDELMLDGNAVAGLLQEVFARRDDDRDRDVRQLRRERAGRRGPRLPRRRRRPALPALRQRPGDRGWWVPCLGRFPRPARVAAERLARVQPISSSARSPARPSTRRCRKCERTAARSDGWTV